MHKNDFFPFIFFSYHSFSLSYLEPQIIFPCRDIGPATATLDPRPRLWTRDPRPATISQTQSARRFVIAKIFERLETSPPQKIILRVWKKVFVAKQYQSMQQIILNYSL